MVRCLAILPQSLQRLYISPRGECKQFFPQKQRLEMLLLPSTYVVSSPLIAYYYTQIIGDAKTPPTLLASSLFTGIAVIGTRYASSSIS